MKRMMNVRAWVTVAMLLIAGGLCGQTTGKQIEKDSSKVVEEILNNFYGRVSPVRMISFTMDTILPGKDKCLYGKTTFRWNNRVMTRRIKVKLGKTMWNGDQEYTVFLLDDYKSNFRYLEEDLPVWRQNIAETYKEDGLKVKNCRAIRKDRNQVAIRVELTDGNETVAVVFLFKGRNPDGTFIIEPQQE